MRQLRFLAISLLTVVISAGCLGGGSSMQTSADGSIGVENDAGAGGVGGSVPGTGGMSSTGGTAELGGVTGTAPPVADGYRLDVLFMVGKTASMGDAQRRLSAAAPAFLVELRRRNLRDVRIAVGSADLGIEGRNEPLTGPDCSNSVGDVGRLPTSAKCLQDAQFIHIQANTVAPSRDANEALACLLRLELRAASSPNPSRRSPICGSSTARPMSCAISLGLRPTCS